MARAEPAAILRRPTGDPPSLLLITMDTVRPDHLEPYGYDAIRTPTLSRLAEEGALFERAVAQAPVIPPSHASLLTGLYPNRHGVHGFHSKLRSGPEVPAIAEILRFLERYGRHPFFLWVHYYDPHRPYLADSAHRNPDFHPGKSFLDRFGAIHGYDSEIVGADAHIGQLLDDLRSLDRLDDTIVVVTSDHGEGLGEHDYQGHTQQIWEKQLRIPLILRFPPRVPEGLRVTTQVRSIDVAPTLLELMDVPVPESLDGESLLGILQGRDAIDRLSFAQFLFRTKRDQSLFSISDGRFKLIRSHGGERWLFNLQADPDELRNLAEERPDLLTHLDRELERHLEVSSFPNGEEEQRLDPALCKRLEVLGYLD